MGLVDDDNPRARLSETSASVYKALFVNERKIRSLIREAIKRQL
jgi:hypothetical protein